MVDLSALRSRWDEAVLSDPGLDEEGCAALRQWQCDQRASFDGRALCQVLRPNFVTAQHLGELARVCRLLASVLRKLTGGQTRGPQWVERAGLSPEAARLIAIDPGFERLGVTVRLDAFETEHSLAFVELNAEAPAGIAYHDVLARMFEGLNVVQELRDEGLRVRSQMVAGHLLSALLTTWSDWLGGGGKPRIAIVDWRDSPTSNEFALLAEAFSRRGYASLVADPRDLEYSQGRLRAGRKRIDLVYRRVLFADVLARPDELRPLVSAVSDGAVCMVNPFRSAMFHRKRLWADLTDPVFLKSLLPAEEEVVRKHIPWTRRFVAGKTTGPDGEEIDLVPWVELQRTRLVLKPDHAYGGAGVRLGWQENDASWSQAISEGLAEDSVVQIGVPLRYQRFPLLDGSGCSADFLVDQAPYLFRGRMGGFLTRLSTGPLANVTAGGSMVPTFVVGP
ncbi:MAG: hypothetical protein VX498_07640 [Myxococcota bacterium]|nr:hypothetical protein [Myxococcota bacterium]